MPRAPTWVVLGLLIAACQKAAPGAAESPPVSAPAQGEALPMSPNLAQARPAAVLELFTSEGCSSCPAADEVLAAITDRAKAEGRRVFTLELHVDYWNYLGWADPFSAPVHGKRQNQYAERFGLNGVYTPQLVVNGRAELVGSDARGARARIDEALAENPGAAIQLDVHRTPSGIEVNYRLDTARAVELRLAIADDRAETRVLRGENAERRLVHRHVVRAFETRTVASSSTGSWLAQPPPGALQQQVFVVAYAADLHTLAVLGADALELPAG